MWQKVFRFVNSEKQSSKTKIILSILVEPYDDINTEYDPANNIFAQNYINIRLHSHYPLLLQKNMYEAFLYSTRCFIV